MSLPKISLPTYECTIPSTGKKVKFRPFVSREEKILLMAMESKEDRQIFNAMSSIIESCTNGDLKTDELSSVDLEWFFLNLRAKSVGEISEFSLTCNNDIGDGQTCNQKIEYSINLLDARVTNIENLKKEISVDGNIFLKLRVPDINTLSSIQEHLEDSTSNALFELLRKCIDYVYEKTKDSEVTKFSDVPANEQRDWIDSLPATVIEQFADYVKNLPKLEHKTQFTCPKCGKVHVQEFSGIGDFFS